MATPREHIEQIRKTKFSIGGEANPLTVDLHQAVKNLSAKLYAEDVHFFMELIQNAEDNEYPEGVDPSLEYVITSRDITDTGAPATLLMFNNENGFSPKNVESVCSVGQSTKKGNMKHGYTGEKVARSTKKGNRKRGCIGDKGIGFKSVFLITSQPYIFSNGYQIRFNERPCPHCHLGYIVPEWVEESPSLSDIQQIYGSGSTLPTTTIILPLKPDKVKPVKQQLSSIHPEVLSFLQKIKRLSVREDNEDPKLNTISAIAITSETNSVTRKNIGADSYTLHLSVEEKGDKLKRECSYYMWRQKFPVRPENKVARRMEVEEWVITLAFPNGERLNRGTSSPGVYAFLPTTLVTNFPFIIQADFVLTSSREAILWDDKWNQGILDCVPSAFINAFISLVKGTKDVPIFRLPQMFGFLPINSSSHHKLNVVRESIRAKLVEEDIIPSGTYMGQKFFHKPSEVGRLMPAFWNILMKAKDQGVNLSKVSSHGRYIMNSSFDKPEYDHILNFLGVQPVNNEWYARCIQSSNLVLGVSEDVYMELLLFLADNWQSKFFHTKMRNIPLIKYVGLDGNLSLCSISESTQWNAQRVLCLSSQRHHVSWLLDWNKQFRCTANFFFVPKSTQEAMQSFSKREAVLGWLEDQVKVVSLNVYEYADVLRKHRNGDKNFVVAYAHFLYQSFSKKFLSAAEVDGLCDSMPLVDNYGCVTTSRNSILVPANGSRWAGLIVSNPWRQEGYVELGGDYLRPGNFAGESTTGEQLIEFFKSHVGASDLPYVSPPNAGIPAVSGPLTKENAFLLLDWIRYLKCRGKCIPVKFMLCVKEGSWLRTTMNGSSGYRPPSRSFFYTSSWGNILQNGSMLVDIALVDQSFYGNKISEYKEELRTMGVMFEYGEACKFIGNRLLSLAASSTLTRSHVLAMLNFIRYLREKHFSPWEFISNIKGGIWLRTSRGCSSPVGSVLFDQEWITASQISDIAFIDLDYYGEEILCFKTELQLLGVLVGFNGSYQLVVGHLKSPSHFNSMTADAVFLILKCMRQLRSKKLVNTLTNAKCLKTNLGYRSPGECYLLDPEWGCILKVFSGFALIDDEFYGSSIFSYKEELKQIGVVVEFEKAVEAFACSFKQQASSSSITTKNVVSLLSCYKKLGPTPYRFPQELNNCIRAEKWLRTRLGDFRSPRNCILFGLDWESVSQITLLPFIDDSDNCYGKGIHEYKKQLKSMGTIIKLKDGVKFVVDGVCFPSDHCHITSANALSLLKCVGIILEERNYTLPEAFLKKVSQKWLKTHAGYKSPDQCLLFDSKWSSFLKWEDGPFIDEEYYGPEIHLYRKELLAIGVTVDVEKGCALLASYLDFHSEFATIVRIYNCLRELTWKPNNGATSRIWIPDGSKNGEWVDPQECVLHDQDGLFGSQFHVLEKHYEPKLLTFFSSTLDVRSEPSLDDYCKLWKVWESTGQRLSHAECSAFWRCVMRHKSSKTEQTLADSLVSLPVGSDSDEILLSNKRDVFIADDLLLKDLFEQSSPHRIFVWYPQPSLQSLPQTKLQEVYRNIGVRTISESVQREELSLVDGVEVKQVNPKNILIGKGLVRLILSFLADPSLKMEAEKRQEAVRYLLNLTVLETLDPITVNYSLLLSSGEILNAKTSQMIRWDRESSKFFTQKMDRSCGHKNLIEYATYFSEVISKGVLWQNEYQIHMGALAELIKLAFFLEFNEEAVGFIMKSKNLQVYEEDEKFLSTAFPSGYKEVSESLSFTPIPLFQLCLCVFVCVFFLSYMVVC